MFNNIGKLLLGAKGPDSLFKDQQARERDSIITEEQAKVKDLRDLYLNLSKKAVGRADSALLSSRASASFGELLKRAGAKDQETAESRYAVALIKFGDILKNSSEAEIKDFEAIKNQLSHALLKYCEEILVKEVKLRVSKYERAKESYISAVEKVEALVSRPKPDIVRLYTLEKELAFHKKVFLDCQYDALLLFDEIRFTRDTHIMSFLNSASAVDYDRIDNFSAYLAQITEYLNELREWCRMQRVNDSEIIEAREQEMQVKLAEQEECKYQDLVKLIATPDLAVVHILFNISPGSKQKHLHNLPRIFKAYNYPFDFLLEKHDAPPPPHDITLQEVNQNDLPALVKTFLENMDDICISLSAKDDKETLVQLVNALAQLDTKRDNLG